MRALACLALSLLAACLTVENNSGVPTIVQAPNPSPDGGSVPDDAGPGFTLDAGGDDSSTPPEASSGTYFASCLFELAGGQPAKAISFIVDVEASKGAASNQFKFTMNALALKNGFPPPTVSRSGIVSTSLLAGSDAYSSTLLVESVNIAIAGSANPIGGSDVVIQSVRLKGRFKNEGFCMRIAGNVIKPEAAARTLDESKNTCLFTPTTDGANAQAHVAAEYSVENCPL